MSLVCHTPVCWRPCPRRPLCRLGVLLRGVSGGGLTHSLAPRRPESPEDASCRPPALLLLGLLALSHDGQGQADSRDEGPPGTGEGSPSPRITLSNTAFALSFYHLVASQSPARNAVFSPLSISAAYALLTLGARSHTRTQLLQGLGFNVTAVPEPDTHLGFRRLLHALGRPDAKLQVRLGSALVLSPGLQPLQGFRNDPAAFYASGLIRANFLDSEGTTRLITGTSRRRHGEDSGRGARAQRGLRPGAGELRPLQR